MGMIEKPYAPLVSAGTPLGGLKRFMVEFGRVTFVHSGRYKRKGGHCLHFGKLSSCRLND